ncbi:glycosyltransferase family 4 protein [Lentzea jiangxiensis]|uniref:glycosyltransferase family 4 protein n=1 Tax=Lentzea jiangxiensis TaxID=641025 RepID=UPI0015A4DE3B|nr:glycosyltransferase family 4 protein [Lentzea jiangxiensis]
MTDSFHPRLGGIEHQVVDLATRQAAAGHDVHVVTRQLAASGSDAGFPFTVHRLRSGWGAQGRLRAVLAPLRPDVVHAHVSVVSPLGWAGVDVAVELSVRAVVSVHSLWVGPGVLAARLAGLKSWARNQVTVAAVSSLTADRVRRTCPELPVHLVPNGIDVGWWRVPHPPDRSGGVHVVAVGRLVSRREPMSLLKAVREVAGSSDVRVTIVGDGPERAKAEAYARRCGLASAVSFAGVLRRTEIRDLLAGADLFVNPARREAFGVATVEALSSGVPVVAMAESGVNDFVWHGKNGFLCEPGVALEDGLREMVTNHDLRRGMAEFAAAHPLVVFDWPGVLARWDALYASGNERTATSGPRSHRPSRM